MRLFAIGDIHGCATALEVILAAIPLGAGDKIVSLGDYINKGPDTKGVIDRLVELHSQGDLIPLLGNHELKLIRAAKLGKTKVKREVLVDHHTLNSYAPRHRHGDLSGIPDQHWQFVEKACLKWLTTEHHIFVHASLASDQPLAEQTDKALFWDKFNNPAPHISGKVMICGHTPQKNGQPLNLGHAICLDTAVCEGQWLTCLEVYSGQIWQANQRGELRQFRLENYPATAQTLPPTIRQPCAPFTQVRR